MSSLPVPLSPVSRTVEETLPIRSIVRKISCIRLPLADDVGEGVLAGELLLEVEVLVLELLLAERPADDEHELVVVERLGDVVDGAALHGLDGVLGRGVGGDHDDRRRRGSSARTLRQQVEAVAVGHLDVAEDDVGVRAQGRGHALGVVGRGRGPRSPACGRSSAACRAATSRRRRSAGAARSLDRGSAARRALGRCGRRRSRCAAAGSSRSSPRPASIPRRSRPRGPRRCAGRSPCRARCRRRRPWRRA